MNHRDKPQDRFQYIRIIGEAEEGPITGKTASRIIHDIERLEGREGETADLLLQGTPILRGFWVLPTLDELAEVQDVKPLADVSALFGTWPDEADDGFEKSINELRNSSVNLGLSS